jgi:hypothetical protein
LNSGSPTPEPKPSTSPVLVAKVVVCTLAQAPYSQLSQQQNDHTLSALPTSWKRRGDGEKMHLKLLARCELTPVTLKFRSIYSLLPLFKIIPLGK